MPPTAATGVDDPAAQRHDRIATGAEPRTVGPLLAQALHDERWRRCDVALISGGKSNLTYRVSSDAGEVVLRRPPLGHILPTAHDMAREFRVLSALEPTAVPVPRVLHLGAAGNPLGVPFYVMERVVGHVCRDALPAGYADRPEQRRAVGEALVDALADLHALDPAQVGLAEFGRPAGFMERQLRRWSAQWEATRVREEPALDRVLAELRGRLPRERPGAIVHGDFRLDNTVLHPTRPGVLAAVLDWEMSTLGDPLADLGALLAYWSEPGDGDVLVEARIVPPVTAAAGFPSRAEIARALRRADRLRRLRRRLLPGVRVLQARGRVPGNRGPRGRRRDARLGLRRRAAPRPPAGGRGALAARPGPGMSGALFDLSGRVAIVTGATRGLGRAIAGAFAQAGADVVVVSRDADACARTAAELRGRAFPCHVGHWGELDALVEFAYGEFGRVDVLVNNAGLSPVYDKLSDVSEALFDKVIAVNLKGPFRLAALVGERMMAADGGSIVNVSSTGAVRPTPDIVPYAAAKAGVNAMTVALAHAFGPKVRVNALMPGPFLTSISAGWDMERFAQRARTFPLRRAGDASEIAGAAVYLASDASSYTTGTVLTVDGGAQWSMAGTGEAA